MDIETELTPNPETLKFIVDKKFIFQHGIEIKNEKEAKQYKFIKNFFEVKGIKSIFIGEDFFAVTKEKNITWSLLKTKILTFILDSISSNKVLIEKKTKSKEIKKTKDKISIKIEKIIDEKVRPAVARDGGDVVFKSFDKGIVYLHMQGSCSGCPSSSATLKSGIEKTVKYYKKYGKYYY